MHDEHWTEREIKHLKRAISFTEAARIAICILERMSATGGEVIQICGPMSTGGLGSLGANMERFHFAVAQAKTQGLHVFNQIPFQEAIARISAFQEDDAEYCMDILELFYRPLFESGHIHKVVFLDDWESSTGAKWEREVAIILGIPVDEYPTEWLVR